MSYEFSRTELLIGKDGLEKLKKSKVAIFGIGGVGSFVAEGLARAGIGKLVLIDSDNICISNLNRQIHATHKTIGMPKVQVMKERIVDINPESEVTVPQLFYSNETCGELLWDYDYIADAIDSVKSKIDLILNAKQRGIRIISSMGAGNKLDPTRFEVADIYSTQVCPLAKIIRKEMRKHGIPSLKVVYSKELPIKQVNTVSEVTPQEELSNVESPTAKKHVPGSISFVPPVAGLIIAGEIIRDLLNL